MTSTVVEVHPKVANVAGLACHQRLRLGTRRSAWPLPSRFDAWTAIARPTLRDHLVRCSAAKRHVRAMFVAPQARKFVENDRKFVEHQRPTGSTWKSERHKRISDELSAKFDIVTLHHPLAEVCTTSL